MQVLLGRYNSRAKKQQKHYGMVESPLVIATSYFSSKKYIVPSGTFLEREMALLEKKSQINKGLWVEAFVF